MKSLLATAAGLALLSASAVAQDPYSAPVPDTPPAVQEPAPATPPETQTPSLAPAPSDKADDLKSDEKASDEFTPKADEKASDELAPKSDDAASLSGEQWRASRLIGQPVRTDADESIGDINDFIIDSSGKVTAVIVGVGGFLGLGEKNVALTFDQLSISYDSSNSLVVMTKAARKSLESAPEWVDPTKAPDTQ